MKRSIENRLDDLEQEVEGNTDGGHTIAYSTPGTDELTDRGGNPIDRDDVDGLLIILNRSFVMAREQAELEGRTILGPAEDAAEDVDAVEVPIER